MLTAAILAPFTKISGGMLTREAGLQSSTSRETKRRSQLMWERLPWRRCSGPAYWETVMVPTIPSSSWTRQTSLKVPARSKV